MKHMFAVAALSLAAVSVSAQTPTQETLERVGGSVCRIWVYEAPYEQTWKKLYEESARNPTYLLATRTHVILSRSSCVVLDPAAGIVVTNHHVVKGVVTGFTAFEAELPGSSKRIPLKLLGSDEDADIAVLRVYDSSHLPANRYLPIAAPPLTWADSDAVRPGQPVVAVGYPLGSYEVGHDAYFWNATTGIVSGMNRNEGVTQFVQTTAITDQGYSGGGLFTADGKFLGIPTEALGRGLSMAVSSNLVRKLADEIVATGTVTRARIGTEWEELQWLSPMLARQLGITVDEWERYRGRALVIVGVAENGPAATAGLRKGDLVLSIDGHEAAWGAGMSRYISMQRKPDEIVQLRIYRPAAYATTPLLNQREMETETAIEMDIAVQLGVRGEVIATK